MLAAAASRCGRGYRLGMWTPYLKHQKHTSYHVCQFTG